MIADQAVASNLDGLRVQVPGEHQIWLVFGDQRHYITGPDVLRAIFRNEDMQVDPECARLPVGTEIGSGSCLVRAPGSDAVYLLVKPTNGQAYRHLVVSPEQFNQYGFAENRIVELDEETLRAMPVGPPLGTAAASSAYVKHQNLEQLASALTPKRPTLLLLLEEVDEFTTRFATHLQETARRRVNVLVGWIEGKRLAVSASFPGAADGPTCRLDRAELGSAAERLRIARVDLLATRFSAETPSLVTAIGRNFDLTPLALFDDSEPVRELARLASRAIACSDAVLSRLKSVSPQTRIELGLDPESTKPNRFRVHPARLAEGDELRVLVWGAVSPERERLVADTVASSLDKGLPIRFFALELGSARLNAAPITGMRNLGALDQLDLNTLVCVLRPHLAWFPEPSLRVFDFRVSAATAQGLPILADEDCGFRSRLAGRSFTWWLQPEGTGGLVASRLLEIREQWPSLLGQSRSTYVIARSFYPDRYLAWSSLKSVSEEASALPEPPPAGSGILDPMAAPLDLGPLSQPQAPASRPVRKKSWLMFR